MFGHDPNPTVTTARVGSGTAFRRAREEGRGLTREVRLGLMVGTGLCRRSSEGKRGKARQQFSETENVRRFDRLYCRYSYPFGRQTDSECDETWQAAYLHYNNTACQLSTHSENIFRPLIK